MIELNELQRDALAEIFNIGVGRAAAGLSLIVNDEVRLSAPMISLMRVSELQEALVGGNFQNFSTVSQRFSGLLSAKAMLIFPEKNALTIVSHMLGETVSPSELSEYEQEAMCEVGNIILNACLSALADMFEISLEGSLPEHQFCNSESIQFADQVEDDQGAVLVLRVLMSISQQEIEGHIVFALSVDSLNSLLDCLNQYLRSQGLEP